MREKQKAYLTEIIAKLNDLFGGDTSDGDSGRVTTKAAIWGQSVLLRQPAGIEFGSLATIELMDA